MREVALARAELGEAHEEFGQSSPILYGVSPSCRLPARRLCHSCKNPSDSSVVASREGLAR